MQSHYGSNPEAAAGQLPRRKPRRRHQTPSWTRRTERAACLRWASIGQPVFRSGRFAEPDGRLWFCRSFWSNHSTSGRDYERSVYGLKWQVTMVNMCCIMSFGILLYMPHRHARTHTHIYICIEIWNSPIMSYIYIPLKSNEFSVILWIIMRSWPESICHFLWHNMTMASWWEHRGDATRLERWRSRRLDGRALIQGDLGLNLMAGHRCLELVLRKKWWNMMEFDNYSIL